MPNGDDIKDRYAGRLGSDEDGEDEQPDQNDTNAENSMSVENAENEGDAQNVWNARNVKKDWKGWTVYLPEPYIEDVKDESKLLDVRLDRDVKLDRHFKPLLIALGMERLQGMEDEEVMEFLERMERGELNE